MGLCNVAHSLAARVVYDFGGHDVSACHISGTDSHWVIKSSAAGIESSRAWVALVERLEEWRKRLPASTADLWGWIVEQNRDTLLLPSRLLRRIDDRRDREGRRCEAQRNPPPRRQARGRTRPRHGRWWTPTAEGYVRAGQQSTDRRGGSRGVRA